LHHYFTCGKDLSSACMSASAALWNDTAGLAPVCRSICHPTELM
jgi:hypothetical protein